MNKSFSLIAALGLGMALTGCGNTLNGAKQDAATDTQKTQQAAADAAQTTKDAAQKAGQAVESVPQNAEANAVRIPVKTAIIRDPVLAQPSNLIDVNGRSKSGMSEPAQEHLNSGIAFARAGRKAEAEAEYRAALSLRPDYALAHSNLGCLFLQQEKAEEAIVELREAIRLKPEMRGPYSHLGHALKQLGRFDEAIVAYRAELEYEPRSPSAYSNMGLAYQEKGDLFVAVAHYRKALGFDPDYAIGHSNLGIALLLQGNIEGAVAEQREAVRCDSTLAKAHFNLGNALSRKEKEDDELAIMAFQEAVHLAPEWALAHRRFADLLAAAERYDEAIAEYRQALHLDPTSAQTWARLGTNLYLRALTENSRPAAEAAKEALERACRLDPKNHEAVKFLSDVNKMLRPRFPSLWPRRK